MTPQFLRNMAGRRRLVLHQLGRVVDLVFCNAPLMISVVILIHALSEYPDISPLRLIAFFIFAGLACFWVIDPVFVILLFLCAGGYGLMWYVFRTPEAW